jgi:hypothetical protein
MTRALHTCHHRSQRRFPLTAAPAAPASERLLPRRGLERLDLLLLAIEALDLHGSEAMLWCCDQLGLSGQFPDRVTLWRSRCRNPLRRASRRGQLGTDEARALITLACSLAQRVYPLLRQMVSSREPADLTAQRWALFRDRFSELVRERFNVRRGAVRQLLDDREGEALRRSIVESLLLSAGPGGALRLEASLRDAQR